MVPGPRYDLLVGATMVVLSVALLAAFGVANVLANPVGLASVALFLAASACSFVASRRPEATAGGVRVDFLTFRGLSGVAIGAVMLLQGALTFLDGDRFMPALLVLSAVFIFAIGAGTMLRQEWIVPEPHSS